MVFCICGRFENSDLELDGASEIPAPNRTRDYAPYHEPSTKTEFPEHEDSRINLTTIPGTPAEETNSMNGHQSPIDVCFDEATHVPQQAPDTGSQPESGSAELTYIGPLYIDEFGYAPEGQYNTATSVPFFNLYSSTMGYTTARLLQFRLNGIVSIPDSTAKIDNTSEV